PLSAQHKSMSPAPPTPPSAEQAAASSPSAAHPDQISSSMTRIGVSPAPEQFLQAQQVMRLLFQETALQLHSPVRQAATVSRLQTTKTSRLCQTVPAVSESIPQVRQPNLMSTEQHLYQARSPSEQVQVKFRQLPTIH